MSNSTDMGVFVHAWGPGRWSILAALAKHTTLALRRGRRDAKAGAADGGSSPSVEARRWVGAMEAMTRACACPLCQESSQKFLAAYAAVVEARAGLTLAQAVDRGLALCLLYDIHNVVNAKLQHQEIARDLVQRAGVSREQAVAVAAVCRPKCPSMQAVLVSMRAKPQLITAQDVRVELHSLRLAMGGGGHASRRPDQASLATWAEALLWTVDQEVRALALPSRDPLRVLAQAMTLYRGDARSGKAFTSQAAMDAWLVRIECAAAGVPTSDAEAVARIRVELHARFDCMDVGKAGCGQGTCDAATVAKREADSAEAQAAAREAGADVGALVEAAVALSNVVLHPTPR